MKLTHLFFFLLAIISLKSWGQNNEDFNSLDIPAADQDDIWSLDFAGIGWMKNSVSPSPNKLSFSTGLTYHYELNFSSQKRFSIALGLGYNYSLLSHIGTFSNDSLSTTHWNSVLANDQLDFSRLNVHRLTFPVEFRIKTMKKVKIYFGYQSSYIVGIKNTSVINEEELILKDFSSLSKFQHGPRLRIGYKDVFVYSNFYLSSLFKNRDQLSIQLFEFGVSLGG